MRLLIHIIIFTISGILFSLCSCRRVNDVVWSQYQDIPETGWDYINVLGFSPWPTDSINGPDDRYTLTMNIRFPAGFEERTISIIARAEDDNKELFSDTLSLPILPPPTQPTGRGGYAIYESIDTIASGLKLTPGFFVELQSLSPQKLTAGILNVGISLVKEDAHELNTNKASNK